MDDLSPLPEEYFTFDGSSRTFEISSTTGSSQIFVVVLQGALTDGNGPVTEQISFEVEIVYQVSNYTVAENSAPQFE